MVPTRRLCAVWLAIITTAGGCAAAVTTNLNINFLSRPERADLIASVELRKFGSRLAVGEVAIHSDGREDHVPTPW